MVMLFLVIDQAKASILIEVLIKSAFPNKNTIERNG